MTEKWMSIEMPNGAVYAIPVHIIADNRAKYYSENDPDTTYEEEYEYGASDELEIKDWAANNMDWKDVKAHAIRIGQPLEDDFQEGWINGKKEILNEKPEELNH